MGKSYNVKVALLAVIMSVVWTFLSNIFLAVFTFLITNVKVVTANVSS